MKKIKHRSLAEQVYQELLKQIINGSRQPGTKISEESVSEEFGISRTPAREALMMLNRDGLVERLPRRGCYIKKFDKHEIAELFECRSVLEVSALQLGFENIDLKQLDSLAEMLEADLENVDDKKKVSLEADDIMHRIIYESCANEHLIKYIKELIRQTTAFRYHRNYDLSNADDISSERLAIINAIRQKQLKKASELLSSHIMSGAGVFKKD